MAKKHLYSVYSNGPRQWFIRKVDRVLHLDEGQYIVSQTSKGEWLCDCPAGTKDTCRHRQMVYKATRSRKVNSGALYDYELGSWVK